MNSISGVLSKCFARAWKIEIEKVLETVNYWKKKKKRQKLTKRKTQIKILWVDSGKSANLVLFLNQKRKKKREEIFFYKIRIKCLFGAYVREIESVWRCFIWTRQNVYAVSFFSR